MKRIDNNSGGFTLIELMIVSAMTLLVILAISAFVVRVFDLPRFQAEQGAITTNLRTNIERMSDDIRDSRIQAGSTFNYIRVVRNDGKIVEYRLNGTDLERRFNDSGSWVRLARNLQNQTNEGTCRAQIVAVQPVNPPCLFRYFSFGGEYGLEVEPVRIVAEGGDIVETVGRVVITVGLDVDTTQIPGKAEVRTEVHLRESPV